MPLNASFAAAARSGRARGTVAAQLSATKHYELQSHDDAALWCGSQSGFRNATALTAGNHEMIAEKHQFYTGQNSLGIELRRMVALPSVRRLK